MWYSYGSRFKVKVYKEKVFNGVSKQKFIEREFYDLYVDEKLHSKHFSWESVNQVIYNLSGKKHFVRKEDYEEVSC